MDYISLHMDFMDGVSENDFIVSDESDILPNNKRSIDLPKQIQDCVSSNMLDYYRSIGYCNYIWTFKDNSEVRGFMNMLPLDKVLGNWEGIVYFEDIHGKEDDLRNFKVFDFFIPEACVGFYLRPPENKVDDELYYLYFEDKPQGLNVDTEGYIQLLYAARGFGYWQNVLLYLQGNPEAMQSSVDEFKTYMPQVFPDFKWDEFAALYEQVKLK